VFIPVGSPACVVLYPFSARSPGIRTRTRSLDGATIEPPTREAGSRDSLARVLVDEEISWCDRINAGRVRAVWVAIWWQSVEGSTCHAWSRSHRWIRSGN
jgi:hypothetical protein